MFKEIYSKYSGINAFNVFDQSINFKNFKLLKTYDENGLPDTILIENKKQIFKIKKNTDYLKRFQVRYDFSTKNNIDLFGVQKQYELLKDFSDQDALFEYLAENQRIALFNLKGEDFLEAGKIVAYDPKKKLLKTEAITDWYYGATPKKIKLKNIYALEIYSAEIYFLEI